MNPETRQIQGAIDNWHDNHYKEIGGWPNKAAKLAYVSNCLTIFYSLVEWLFFLLNGLNELNT